MPSLLNGRPNNAGLDKSNSSTIYSDVEWQETMTDPSTKAREIAEHIWRHWPTMGPPGRQREFLTPIIAAALQEYGEECVKVNLKKCITFHCESCHQDQNEFDFPPDECEPGCCCEDLRRIKKADAEGYRRGIEEATKEVQEHWSEPEDLEGLLKKIRALLPSEGK